MTKKPRRTIGDMSALNNGIRVFGDKNPRTSSYWRGVQEGVLWCEGFENLEFEEFVRKFKQRYP